MPSFIVIDFNVEEFRLFNPSTSIEMMEFVESIESIKAFVNKENVYDIIEYDNQIVLEIIDFDIIAAIALHIASISDVSNKVLVLIQDIEKYRNLVKYLENFTHINITLCDNLEMLQHWLFNQ